MDLKFVPTTLKKVFDLLELSILRHAKVCALIFIGVLVIAAMEIPGLSVDSSAYSLIHQESKQELRLMEAKKRFGAVNTFVLVIAGSREERRQEVVQALLEEFSHIPSLAGRVFAKLDFEQIAEVLFLHDPGKFDRLAQWLGGPEKLATTLEGGAPALLQEIKSVLDAHTSRLAERLERGHPVGRQGKELQDSIKDLHELFDIFELYYEGEGYWEELVKPFVEQLKSEDMVLDDEGYIIGRSERQHYIILMPQLESDEVLDIHPLIVKVRGIADRIYRSIGRGRISIGLSGIPVLKHDEHLAAKEGMRNSVILSFCAVFIALLLYFYSIRTSLLAFLPLIPALIFVLAAANKFFGGFNVASSAVIAIILAFGIRFSVGFIVRHGEILRRGLSGEDALFMVVRRSGPAHLLAATAIVIAFLASATTQFSAFTELGLLAVLGIIGAASGILVFYPAFLTYRVGKRNLASRVNNVLRSFGDFVEKNFRNLIIGLLVLVIGSAYFATKVEFSIRYTDFLPIRSEGARALRALEKDRVLTPDAAWLVTSDIEQAREWTEILREKSSVAAVYSPSDSLPALTKKKLAILEKYFSADKPVPNFSILRNRWFDAKALNLELRAFFPVLDKLRFTLALAGFSNDAVVAFERDMANLISRLDDPRFEEKRRVQAIHGNLANILERAWTNSRDVVEHGRLRNQNLPGFFRLWFAAKYDSAVRLLVYPRGNFWDRTVGAKFIKDIERLDPQATGFILNLHRYRDQIIRSFIQAGVWALLVIFVLLTFGFYSLLSAVLVMLPVLLSAVVTLGVMGALGISLNYGNILVLPLLFGIGLDSAVHLVWRCHESAHLNGGKVQVSEVLGGAGGSVFAAALITLLGFAGLLLSPHGGLQSFALLTMISILCSLLVSIIFLPLLVLAFRRTKAPPALAQELEEELSGMGVPEDLKNE